MPLEVLHLIVLELVQLVVVLLVVLEPQLHHRRSLTALLVQLPPPGRPLQLLDRYVVLADRLVLPLGRGGVYAVPELKGHLKLEEVVLLLAESPDEDPCLADLHGLVLEGRAARDVVPVGVLDLDLDHVQVLRPLEGGPHEDGLALLCLESSEGRVEVGAHVGDALLEGSV